MNDLFLKRMQAKNPGYTPGNNIYLGAAVKNQSDEIMDATFFNDAHTVPVHVYYPSQGIDVNTYAKYQRNGKFSISQDYIDYHLQFRTKEHYPIGCYVDVPDDTGEMRTWLLVGRDDNPQFIKYSILLCNWNLQWIVDNKIYSCLGCLRNRNSYNSGTWRDTWLTSVENQTSFWVPTNPDTQTIYYDMRFIISDNKIHPLTYAVSKLEDTHPQGVIKIILSQDMYDPDVDNADLMIADYYINHRKVVEANKDVHTKITSSIDISSWKTASIVMGSDYATMYGRFYENGNEIQKEGMWEVQFPENFSEEKKEEFSIMTSATSNMLQIKCQKDYDLVGSVITIIFKDIDGGYVTSQEIEVVAR